MIIEAVGFLSSFQLWLSSQKNVAVRIGYRPVLAAAMIVAGAGSNVVVASWFYVREGDLGLWMAAYLITAVRGRYRPVFIVTAIAAYIPWLVLPPGGRRARTIEVVIVDVCLAVMCQRTTGQAR